MNFNPHDINVKLTHVVGTQRAQVILRLTKTIAVSVVEMPDGTAESAIVEMDKDRVTSVLTDSKVVSDLASILRELNEAQTEHVESNE